MKPFMYVYLLVVVLFGSACASEQTPGADREAAPPGRAATLAPASSQEGHSPYVFERPDVSFALPEELREISGLTVLSDGRLGAVQDEAGILFILNPETGGVEARQPFGDAADYEGVERVGERLFVLRSNGHLVELEGWAGGTAQARLYKTGLKGKNDTEGLAYDEANGRLLIACKEDPGGGLGKDQKAIYAFDLTTGVRAPDPALVIDLSVLEGQLAGKESFKPSALAIHPVSGEVFVLSSVAKAIAVLGREGSLQTLWPLSEAMFEQPEGLAFLPDGTLFIASEGADGPAMLYRFSYDRGA